MEYELFQSELKSSVNGALISGMIRSSSSGLHSHRAAAMELILERSIQDRRERVLAEAKNGLPSDPAPRSESEAPSNTTGKGIETGRGEEPPAGVGTIPSPSEDFVELVCPNCDVKQPRSSLWSGAGCGLCPLAWCMKCVGCETLRRGDVDACTGCHGKVK